jgi:protein-disulfide isomerase
MSSRVNQKQANRVVREQLAREKARTRRLWVTIGAVAVLVIAGLIGWGVYASQRPDSYTAPAHTSANDDGLVIGSGSATVEVYLDFMCPHCKEFEDAAGGTLNKLVDDKKIKLVYHPVAFLDGASTTEYSTRSSAASGCASDAGKLREFVTAMYANQPPESSAGLSNDEIIAKSGISGADFASCVREQKYKDWVSHVTDAATNRGVNGTPTVYVNGKQVEASADAITKAVG